MIFRPLEDSIDWRIIRGHHNETFLKLKRIKKDERYVQTVIQK